MTAKEAIAFLDLNEVYLDELLQAILDECNTKEDGRWLMRTLLDCIPDSALRAELEWRGGREKVDPFGPFSP